MKQSQQSEALMDTELVQAGIRKLLKERKRRVCEKGRCLAIGEDYNEVYDQAGKDRAEKRAKTKYMSKSLFALPLDEAPFG